MQSPASVYQIRTRALPNSIDDITYDDRHIVRPVRNNGTVRWKGKEVFVTEILRRERIGLLPMPTGAFRLYFSKLHLGIPDSETATFNPNHRCLAEHPTTT